MATYEQAYEASLEYYAGDELPAKTFVDKYALRDEDDDFKELIPTDMQKRTSKELHRIESKYPNPRTYDEIFEAQENFKYFSLQGSGMFGVGNPYSTVSLSNCFVIEPPEDDLSSIVEQGKQMANIFSRRGGVGVDLSKLRPEGMSVNNAARTTTGAWSFADFYSYVCRMIGQSGRRGALMISLDVRHPDVFKFAKMKRDKSKVTGANVSIKLNDEFVQAVIDDGDFTLQWPVESKTPEITKVIRARDLWEVIVDSAHQDAEPGLMMWDTMMRELPAECYRDFGFKHSTTNPCISGDTLIAVADGRNAVSIKELTRLGADVPVYSTNVVTGKVEIKWGRSPRVTKKNAQVWELLLDDGSVLKATPDHKVLLKSGEYKELQNLKEGESVFPFYSFNSNGYRQVSNVGAKMKGGARRNRRQYRLISEFYGQEVDPKVYAIHHRDFDSSNDSIDNLQVMTHDEHRRLHAEKMEGIKNPYHKMTDEWKFNFASHPGKNNPRYLDVSNEEIVEKGRELFDRDGKITYKSWSTYAKANGLPQFLSNEFRFGTFDSFKNIVINNHKVVSVRFVGVEDVYNITVDDNHNYHVITSGEGDYTKSSGLCVKNCGEIVLSPGDSCRLLAMNLTGFVKNAFEDNSKFDLVLFKQKVSLAQRMMDNLVDLELESISKIINKVDTKAGKDLWKKIHEMGVKGRRTGLGYFGLADALAQLGIKYDSDEALEMVEKIDKVLCHTAYEESATLAEERGAFPVFDWELEKENSFIKRLPKKLRDKMSKTGRRNISILTNAPTGSLSIVAFNVSSGIEPVFMTQYTRRKKINPSDTNARVDFIDEQGDRWQEFSVFHKNAERWIRANHPDWDGVSKVRLPEFFISSGDIDWEKRVDIQSVIQKYRDHSISSTINLPSDVSKEVVGNIYLRAWEKGLKGVTVYRDGSRSGVLISNKVPSAKEGRPTSILVTQAPRRPNVLPCDVYHGIVGGELWTIVVGLMDNNPYELFGGPSVEAGIPRSVTTGYLEKIKASKNINRYNLIYKHYNSENVVEDISQVFENKVHGTFTRMLSLSLRHGAPVQHIVEQLGKDDSEDLYSLSSVLRRALKKYIQDGASVCKSSAGCDECGSSNLKYQEGCPLCMDCGYSKCS